MAENAENGAIGVPTAGWDNAIRWGVYDPQDGLTIRRRVVYSAIRET